MPSHAAELTLMEQAARQAGAIIMGYFRLGETIADSAGVREKSLGNPLTDADMAVDRLLRRLLTGARPDYGWLSEESADSPARASRERVWVVDPIDGTRGFIRGIPQFAVSIALVERGQPVAACIYNPASDEMFTAGRNAGTRLNGRPVATSGRRELHGARCLVSRSETRRGEWEPFRDELELTLMGSIAYKLALVAAGAFDMTFTLTPKCEWDCSAGVLLVLEAGGAVSQKDGLPCAFNQEEPRFRSLLATNGPLHPPLLARLEGIPLNPDRLVGSCLSGGPRKPPSTRSGEPR